MVRQWQISASSDPCHGVKLSLITSGLITNARSQKTQRQLVLTYRCFIVTIHLWLGLLQLTHNNNIMMRVP